MSRGLERERRVARILEDEGWVVASRRHIGGAGDLIAIRAQNGSPEVRLIEVKSTARPYERFGPADRLAMRRTARACGGDAYLCWWPRGAQKFEMRHEGVWALRAAA